ncbi:MAG: TetR/AcrR family transcriptional regulator [Acidothermaceae bacterium]
MSDNQRKYELKARAEQVAETRQRIVEAAAGLHVEVGPARTTMTEIARRAGVQRATVYSHFPDDGELFAACGDYSLARNPPPDPSAALALDEPVDRLRAVLASFYAWYRTAARGLENLQRDRRGLPGLDEAMVSRVDQPISRLVDALAAGFAVGNRRRDDVHAMVALALDFWTWRRLAAEGLSDENAAALMAGAALASGGLLGKR